jgi:hypothetical protein
MQKISFLFFTTLITIPGIACTPPSTDPAKPAVTTTVAPKPATPTPTAAAPHNPSLTTVAPPPTPGPIPAPSDVAAPPVDAIKTASGLAYKTLSKGTGTKKPAATDSVLVHYTGWKIDGTMFDSSVVRGQPIAFPLNRVIPGWTEGVQLMNEGDKTRFWIPAKLAYGDVPTRPGAPAGMLVFDVELIKIQ